MSLGRGYIKVEDIDRNQEYIPYITSSRNRAFGIWQGINHRCNKKSSRKCYDDSVMRDSWARDPELIGGNAFTMLLNIILSTPESAQEKSGDDAGRNRWF